MFLRQNSSFQSVKNPLKILILTFFFEGWLCIISPYATGLFAKSSTQKKAFTLCLFSLITTCSYPGILLFISVLAINPYRIVVPGWFPHRRLNPEGRDWLRCSQHRWMISSARAQPRVCVSSVWTLVNRASVETTVFICFVTQKPMQFFCCFFLTLRQSGNSIQFSSMALAVVLVSHRLLCILGSWVFKSWR